VKGGWLARAAYPATVLTLILSDVVGDPIDTIASGPTSPDTTTFASAISILKIRRVWRLIPESVRRTLTKGVAGKIDETPKQDDKIFRNVTNVIIGNNRTVCNAAWENAKRASARSIILTTLLEGEAREVGIVISAIARELEASRGRSKKPFTIIMGGETTVTVRGNGKGGRNQEMMLGASTKLNKCQGIAIASIGTDGLDGNTPAAGAIVDGHTVQRAEDMNMKPLVFLQNNDSHTLFTRLHDAIMTGATGTNLNDVTIATIV